MLVRSDVAVLVMLVALGCSGSLSEVRSERDAAVALLMTASAGAPEDDLVLIRHLRHLLPGEEVPKPLLRNAESDARFPAVQRLQGQLGTWRIEALQTTNDSQAGCVPWGTISAVSFFTTRANAAESYADWRKRITAMLKVPPAQLGALRASWLKSPQSPWYASWYASLEVTSPDRLTIEMSCENGFTVRRGREGRGE